MLKCLFVNSGSLFVNLPVFGYGIIGFCLLAVRDLSDEYKWNLSLLNSRKKWIRYAAVIALISYVLLFGVFNNESFIYFQF